MFAVTQHATFVVEVKAALTDTPTTLSMTTLATTALLTAHAAGRVTIVWAVAVIAATTTVGERDTNQHWEVHVVLLSG